MARRRRKSKSGKWVGRALSFLLAIPGIYLVAALIGSLTPVNRGWIEPEQGMTVYIADNGIHADIVMPVKALGLDWAQFVPRSDVPSTDWIAFGSGEERVYLNTPTWWNITPDTVWSALTGGNRVMHVEYVPGPEYAVREIRLRPEEYRRLGQRSAPTSRSIRRGGQSGYHTRVTAVATLSTARRARKARSAPATAGSRDG